MGRSLTSLAVDGERGTDVEDSHHHPVPLLDSFVDVLVVHLGDEMLEKGIEVVELDMSEKHAVKEDIRLDERRPGSLTMLLQLGRPQGEDRLP